ncbi:hypothetical protein TRFO_03471 [Tritrichomonas foetus]|uniref:Uncharacterized protein n=1 Tax=Tritrichomonas foetus TaxID=1144522 RepID=A0A1J4KP91_9EUKA|nr:hypothetical protein TRFO_03471 [Tritrichomonas foetus]|eukprot:OHT13051.1 hypothetical protein TRFO_03471 [Tritrichomonas foetus]
MCEYKLFREPMLEFETSKKLISSDIPNDDIVGYILGDELPNHLEFDIYNFLNEKCLQYSSYVNENDVMLANLAIQDISDFFRERLDFFKSNSIDYSTITNIFIQTNFLQTLHNNVDNQIPEYLPNCVYFITVMTNVSPHFGTLLSERDFVAPLISYLLDQPILTNYQKQSFFIAINNLLEFYYRIDEQYKCVFNNFFILIDYFRTYVPVDKIAKFIYITVKFAVGIELFYSTLIFYFGNFCTIESFQYIIRSLFIMSKKYPDTAIIITRPDCSVLNLLFEMMIESNELEDEFYAYTRLIIEVLRSFNIIITSKEQYGISQKDQFEIEQTKERIIKACNLGDIMNLLTHDNYLDNRYAIEFIEALFKNKLLDKIVNDPTQMLKDIINVFEDSKMNLREIVLTLLQEFIIADYCSEFILNNLDISILCDFLESDTPSIQIFVIDFLCVTLTRIEQIYQGNYPQFLFKIINDADFMEVLEECGNSSVSKIALPSRMVLGKIRFWIDAYNIDD